MTDILDYFDRLEELARAQEWELLEGTFHEVVEEEAGEATARLIQNIRLNVYAEEMERGLRKAVTEALQSHHEAVLFRYQLNEAWKGAFYLCPNYDQFEGEEEWWAAEAFRVSDGPDMPELGAVYVRSREMDDADTHAATMLYLVARTVATLGHQVDKMDLGNKPVAVCAAYTGQEPFTRVREYERPKSGELPAVELPDDGVASSGTLPSESQLPPDGE